MNSRLLQKIPFNVGTSNLTLHIEFDANEFTLQTSAVSDNLAPTATDIMNQFSKNLQSGKSCYYGWSEHYRKPQG
jgi:hypothetical protein